MEGRIWPAGLVFATYALRSYAVFLIGSQLVPFIRVCHVEVTYRRGGMSDVIGQEVYDSLICGI